MVEDYQSSPLLGEFTIEQALAILLSKTPLTYKFIDTSNSIIIESTDSRVVPKSGNLTLNKTPASEIEELLIVSARHHEELLQDVPISISVFHGKELEDAGIQNLIQLAPHAANVVMEATRGTHSTLAAYIRGIGQSDPLPGLEPGVGIYIDDVYLDRPQGAVLEIYNVERIEILRGPQGTLYGRNTIGGAIKYITKHIENEPSVNIKTAIGNYRQTDIIVTGSTPVANDLFRIGGTIASLQRNGFGKNIFTGKEHYDKNIIAGRASLELTPNDNAFIRIAMDHVNDNSNPKPGYRNTPSQVSTNSNGEFYQPLDNVFNSRAGATTMGHPIDKYTQTMSGASLSLKYNIHDALTLHANAAFRKSNLESPLDVDGLPVSSADIFIVYDNNQKSIESKLVYTGNNYSGVFGLYYLDAEAKEASDSVSELVDFTGIFDGVTQPGGVEFTSNQITTSSWAVFFDTNLALSNTIELSLGARYTSENKKIKYLHAAYVGVLASPYFSSDTKALFFAPFDNNREDSEFTPRLSISWKPDNHHLYASYAQGFKAGGFNPRGIFIDKEEQDGFGAEKIDTYEIGLKSMHFDERLSSNLAFFYSDYSNIQIYGSRLVDIDNDGENDGIRASFTSGGEARILGLEYDLTTHLSDSLDIQLTLGLLNTKFTKHIVAQEITINNRLDLKNVDIADERVFENAPKTSLSLALTYTLPIWAEQITIIGSGQYSGASHQLDIVAKEFDQAGYTLFNCSMIWESNSHNWKIGLYALNLSDKRYITASFNLPDSGNVGTTKGEGSSSAFYGNPRTITATVNYIF